jgi:glutamyl-tRNA synthetase
MNNYLSLLGWNDGTEKEIYTPQELSEAFELTRVVKSSAVFDMAKLRWMNGQHLRALPVEQLSPLVGSALVEEGVCSSASGAFVDAATAIASGSMELVQDAVPQVKTILSYPVRLQQE